MAAPQIRVDAVIPPPLGSRANGTKTSGVAMALTVANPDSFRSMHWKVDANPGCTAVLSGGGADPVYPYSTTLTATGIGTVRITAVGDLNASGDQMSIATVFVLTARGGRVPIVGEETEYDSAAEWHDAVEYAVKQHDFDGGGAPASATVSGGPSLTIDLSKGSFFVFNVTDNTPFAFGAPSNPQFVGQKFTVYVKNASGGVMGNVTWNGAFLMQGGSATWVKPADTKAQASEFQYLGSNQYVELSRAAADIF